MKQPYKCHMWPAPKVSQNPEPWLKGMIDEEQLDEKDAAMYKADDEVVMEEKECNGDEPSSIVSTEDLKQTNEGEKNELLKCEISMQLQARQQLSYPHNKKNYLLYISGKWHCVGGYCS